MYLALGFDTRRVLFAGLMAVLVLLLIYSIWFFTPLERYNEHEWGRGVAFVILSFILIFELILGLAGGLLLMLILKRKERKHLGAVGPVILIFTVLAVIGCELYASSNSFANVLNNLSFYIPSVVLFTWLIQPRRIN